MIIDTWFQFSIFNWHFSLHATQHKQWNTHSIHMMCTCSKWTTNEVDRTWGQRKRGNERRVEDGEREKEREGKGGRCVQQNYLHLWSKHSTSVRCRVVEHLGTHTTLIISCELKPLEGAGAVGWLHLNSSHTPPTHSIHSWGFQYWHNNYLLWVNMIFTTTTLSPGPKSLYS